MFSTPEPSLPASDFADLLARAVRRRRRRRRAALLTVAPAIAAVAVVGMLPSALGPSTLQPIGTSPQDRHAPHDPSETPSPSSEPSPSESASLLPFPLPSLLPGNPTPSSKPKPSPTETSSPGPKPSPPTPKPSRSLLPGVSPDEPAEYTYVTGTAPADCARGPNDPPVSGRDPDDINWCWRYTGSTTLVAGTKTSLPFEVCRAANTLPGHLEQQHFGEQTSWLKARVLPAGDETDPNWYWYGVSGPNAPEITVQAGDCLRWTVPWTVSDEYGTPLPPGEYEMLPVFIVKQIFQAYAADPDADEIPITVTKD